MSERGAWGAGPRFFVPDFLSPAALKLGNREKYEHSYSPGPVKSPFHTHWILTVIPQSVIPMLTDGDNLHIVTQLVRDTASTQIQPFWNLPDLVQITALPLLAVCVFGQYTSPLRALAASSVNRLLNVDVSKVLNTVCNIILGLFRLLLLFSPFSSVCTRRSETKRWTQEEAARLTPTLTSWHCLCGEDKCVHTRKCLATHPRKSSSVHTGLDTCTHMDTE